jgi:hypothetical protein
MSRSPHSGQPLAVAVLHGAGRQPDDFARPFIDRLISRMAENMAAREEWVASQFHFLPVHWQQVLQPTQDQLWHRLLSSGRLGWRPLRRFLVDYATDAIAYERDHRSGNYERIHRMLQDGLRQLAERAGAVAPLFIVAHSLGCIITSNFLWDLQHATAPPPGSPLERGHTLAGLFTLGCPLAFWAARFPDNGEPVTVPSPELHQHHPAGTGAGCGWYNLFDPDDVLALPLRPLNLRYQQVVIEDRVVRSGGPLVSKTPLAHADFLYWRSQEVVRCVGDRLAAAWRQFNPDVEPVPARDGAVDRLIARGRRLNRGARDLLESNLEWARLVVDAFDRRPELR